MIIVRLKEGLGNQMFQYACGKSLARRFKTKLVLDTRFIAKSYSFLVPREFCLDKFRINDALFDEIPNDLIPNEVSFVKEEKHLQYDPALLEMAGKNSYLFGFWQSWKYSRNIEPLIRKKFRFSMNSLSPSVLSLGESVKKANSVSVHIRRTDYLQPELKYIGTLPLDYYDKAFRHIMDHAHPSAFYIFSDDPDWAAKNIVPPAERYIVRGNTNIEDLYLMSQCRHNIIANSTYSWWGAWLNTYSDKIVIAPQKWFLGSNINTDDTDLIPPGWITIDF